MGAASFIPIIGDVLGIVKEAVVDKDKRNEINLKLAELQHSVQMALITSQTVPWVDALVKFMYALVALAAPIGSFAITAFGLYCYYKQVQIPEHVHTLITSAFPAWRGMRHLEKKAGVAIPDQPRPTKKHRDEDDGPRRYGPPR